MADTVANPTTQRYAVVTGANKGIGFEVVRQLASKQVVVVLTARDEKRGLEAVEKLRAEGLFDYVVFHQLNVTDPDSCASLADFVQSKFGKLDILVNNAGIAGVVVDVEAFEAVAHAAHEPGGAPKVDWSKMAQPYEAAAECLQTNYYGVKRVVAALLPLLQLSDHPIIVNVSSSAGKLKNIPSERIRGILDDTENLTEEKLDDLLDEFLKDMKEGALESKGWPQHMAAYFVSKAALNAYARILAEKYPNVCINSVCPGYVKTDINYNTGVLSVEDGAASVVRLALLEKRAPSGRFFIRQEDTDY
uniref:Short-chain dehydrogenase/reductase n=1 Tax=Kalanchoe fedtschenkoi TaxID=63787 RepID=A0A7N0UE81_KALFE